MQKTSNVHNAFLLGTAAIIILAMMAVALPRTGSAQEQAPPATAPGATFDQRVQQRKAEQNTPIEDRDQKRLIAVCSNAQSKVRASQQKTAQVYTKRNQAYLQIDGRILVMIGKLKIAQKDTFEFENQRAELAEKTGAFKATGDNYKQALDDLVVINCKADPAGFKAVLDTARAYNAELLAESIDIKAYIVDTIKPTLSAYAKDMQGSGSASAADQGEGN